MAVQIANPVVVEKIERLARATGLSKTAAVEKAVDRFISETIDSDAARARMDALLAQMDRIPDSPAPFDPFDWDDHGLPR